MIERGVIGQTAMVWCAGAVLLAGCGSDFGNTDVDTMGVTPSEPTVGEPMEMMTPAMMNGGTESGAAEPAMPDADEPQGGMPGGEPAAPTSGALPGTPPDEMTEVDDEPGENGAGIASAEGMGAELDGDAELEPSEPAEAPPPEEPMPETDDDGEPAEDPAATEEEPGEDAMMGETSNSEETSSGDPELPMTDHCAAVADWDPEWVQWEEEVLLLVNEARSEPRTCAQPEDAAEPLTMNGLLTCAARLHSVDMYERDFFAHDNLDGVDPATRVTEAGYEWGATAENIAYGYSSPSEVVEGWLESTGHCTNIMNGTYTEIGIGYHPGNAGERFSSNAHYWTQNFGAPLGSFGGGGGGGGGFMGGGGGGFGQQ